MTAHLTQDHMTRQGYSTFANGKSPPIVPNITDQPWWSRLFFSYANTVMDRGHYQQLAMSDLWELASEHQTRNAFQAFKHQYLKHGRSLTKAMVTTYGWDFVMCGLGSFIIATCTVFAPIVLRHVIDGFNRNASAPETNVNHDLILWLIAFFVSRLVNAFLTAHVTFKLQLVMLRMTISLKSLIFEKATKRSKTGDNSNPEVDTSTVDISNLFTADMDNFMWAGQQVNMVWIFPIQIAVVIYLLYLEMSWAVFAGLAAIFVFMLVNFFVTKGYFSAYEGIIAVKDDRMKVIKEVFGAIQIVKFNAWEEKFLQIIRSWRAKEMKFLAKFTYLVQITMFFFFATPLCVSATSFAVYALVMKQHLTAAKVFTSMVLFGAIRGPLGNLPEAIQSIFQARISLARIAQFLEFEEVDPCMVVRDGSSYPAKVMISVENATLGWAFSKRTAAIGEEELKLIPKEEIAAPKYDPVLSDVNITIEKGDLAVIHGAVGSGKSSLCSGLLGEIISLDGKIFVRGESVAYYSQQPWIQHMTIRDNILFDLPFDADKYHRVIDACALAGDLKQFPAGDATEIGHKGVNLSGGQKARVSLARACYADADIYVLDSPLAAVDVVVQSEIFRKCFCGLLAEKTVVLVTHNPEIINSDAVNYKILLQDGRATTTRVVRSEPRSFYSKKSIAMVKKTEEVMNKTSQDVVEDGKLGSGVLVEEEDRQDGRVSREVFMKYFSALGGVKFAFLLGCTLIAGQGLQVSSDLWLSHWAPPSETSTSDEDDPVNNAQYYVGIYALLGVATAVCFLLRSCTIAFISLRASQDLFDTMTTSLMQAPIRFFDANPIGRVINRYSEDISAIDVELSFNYGCVVVSIVSTLFQLATAIYVIQYASVLLLPLALIYFRVASYFLMPSREITRLLKVSGSPVLSYVTQCEEGMTVLRAFGPYAVRHAIEENFRRIDDNNRAWYADTLVNQWFALRIQLVGCGVVSLVVAALVYFKDTLSPGLVGLAFMYAVVNDEELVYLIRVWTRLELSMVSPERVMEYIGIPPEGRVNTISVPSSWPQRGTITFENVVFNYKPEAPPVLKGVSFAIRDNEKVGIVGRTGAGKSSLTMALFRMNELVSGRILIHDVDIATVKLHTLRSLLSIIPQSPVLFKGNLRAYMDPFEEYSDDQIWMAFEKVGLKAIVSVFETKLDHELTENGENFSVGERQLLCLARALLRQSRVVVLDEATASIDHNTEQQLQKMIMREFANATVLTIAHRLATVLESDRIIVMSDGKVVEFDTPRKLASNSNGIFHQLASEGGCLSQLLR